MNKYNTTKRVANGETIRPVGRQAPTAGLPDREAFIRSLPHVKTDSGRILGPPNWQTSYAACSSRI